MKRGEVYMANLQPRSGSEQRGSRPVVVISNDGFNQNVRWRSMIVIPFTTSRSQRGRGPTAVFVGAGSGGLREDSIAICHQVTTLDRAKLGAKLGTLTQSVIEEIEVGLKAATGL